MARRGVLYALLFLSWGMARADGILDVWPGSVFYPFNPPEALFPNWQQAPTAAFTIHTCDDVAPGCDACPDSAIVGVTMMNYGTATGGAAGDIKGMYMYLLCDATDSGMRTMTYAGDWDIGASTYPAWTWAGSIPYAEDPCDVKACLCYPSLFVYTDIGSCPTNGATVELGPGYNASSLLPGGVTDDCGYDGPTGPYKDVMKTIRYTYKTVDKNVAAPGDTITYTIFYGRPGTSALNNIWITDSLPDYTHWNGVASPAPDAGWDPEVGPPQRLRWRFGSTPTAGGPTSELTFQVTVDWGNQEWFEPGSGDVAAPEGQFLFNQAHMSWDPGGCAPGSTSNAPSTTVRRYSMYMLGDNDLLFAPKLGVPDDEMIYSITIKNISSSKTWWNVNVWDTVPPELDVWAPGYGISDPCLGWTMTPSGCVAANAGRVVTGSATILTWRLDMPPGATLTLRWKARVDPTAASPGDTAINQISVLALGRPAVIDGTGHQGVPKNFVHLAAIVLRTSYLTYGGIGGDGLGKLGVFITFYPLNKAANFELRALEYQSGDPWTVNGGLSASIGTFVGSCIGGFPGGTAGCKAERAPADYSFWSGGLMSGYPYDTCGSSIGPGNPCSSIPVIPYHYIYKIIANAPVLWQLFSCAAGKGFTWTPSTSLTFSGYMHYCFRRRGVDQFNIINTSVGPSGLDPTLATTVHLMTWDPAAYTWVYQTSYELDKESHVYPDRPVCNAHYRFFSSQTQLVIRQVMQMNPNVHSSMSPTRAEGNLSTGTVGEAFYLFPSGRSGETENSVAITNMGPLSADYRIEKYIPRDTSGTGGAGQPWLRGNSGLWYFIRDDTVAPASAVFPAAAAAHIYGTGSGYDATLLFGDPPGDTLGLFRITLLSGGPIQISAGTRILATYGGGTLLHAKDGPVGKEFWITEPWSWLIGGSHCNSPYTSLWAVDLFCPKEGMVVTAQDTDGYLATYTTTGPDQCVAFLRFTDKAPGERRNIKFTVTGGDAIVMYNHCQPSHKFFTAPFLQTGVHYDIIAPPTVFVGQSFWITVVVVDQGGGTKTTYTGTTNFTSSDPTGILPTDYTWALGDEGVMIFYNVTMTKLGLQTIVATDIKDGSILGMTTVMVVGADIKLFKEPPLTVAASGDAVTFRICWSNYSSASAFDFTITDAVPVGTTYVPDAADIALCGSTNAFVEGTDYFVAYSTSTSTSPPGTFTAVSGAASPPPETRWLRWTVIEAGVNATGCFCFRVQVD